MRSVVVSRRVVTPSSTGPASVHIEDGIITRVGSADERPADAEVFDAGDLVVMPGLVDTHVHINEPGRTDWEGFESATRAAAAGGVTSVVDMPLNSIPATTSVDGLRSKIAAARGKCRVDVGFWGGVVPGNAGELRALVQAGVLGFKCFLVDSGVREFGWVAEADLRGALPELVESGKPLLVHAELAQYLNDRETGWLGSRPHRAEDEAVALMVRLCAEFRARVHIVHLSSADALPALWEAKSAGLPISVETCPHYLALAAEEIPERATEYKCAPPIRERENRERLWTALGEGLIDMVVSDHSPCPPELKCRETGDFLRAWGGISSLELGLAVIWSEARTRGYAFANLAEWMSRAPARLAGLHGRKGALREGHDADLAIWNPEAEFTVEAARLQQRHKLTPYAGRVLRGVVEKTLVRGRTVYQRGTFPGEPAGRILS
jgi:allantoinase